MQASDFTPGQYITDAQRLIDWLRYEEAVYLDNVWFACRDALLCHDAATLGSLRREYRIRQALRRVSPQTQAALSGPAAALGMLSKTELSQAYERAMAAGDTKAAEQCRAEMLRRGKAKAAEAAP